MYRIATIEDRIRVPPEKLGTDVAKALRMAISEQMDGVLNSRLGMVLSVVAIDKIGEGKIMPNDPGVYYDCEFRLLSFKPEMNEIVEGEAIDNTEFGAFVRMGPMDGLVHISQLIDDFVSFDAKNSVFLGKESKRTLKEGDMVRGRVISASFGSGENKVGLTMRQSGLGGMAWIEDDKRKMKLGGKAEKAEKPEKPKSEKKEKKE